jgi:NAD(P)-dependent dehydrogenase (short-subunit alcohol dehydrogenase family)
MADAANRVVFVAGASGGLGGAVCEGFLATGATVVAAAHVWDAAVPRRDRLLTLEADVGTLLGAERAIQAALEYAGRLDGVVHLVGGFAGGKTIADTDDDTWDRMLNLNLRTAFNVFRAALPHLLAQNSGRLVAVGSRAALHPAPTIGAYSVSKAALVALVQAVALEVAGKGVTANVVLPSTIDTPANRAADPKADPRRWVQPKAIADLILYLTSAAAADVNGAAIPIYGNA